MSSHAEHPSGGQLDIPDSAVEKAFGLLAEHALLSNGSKLTLSPQSPFNTPGFGGPQSDRHTMELELLLTVFQTKIWDKIQALRHNRNSVALIHRLPFELLVNIFLLVQNSAKLEEKYRALHQMAQVCCTWRDTILCNPRFWTYVSSQLPLFLNKQIIKRSKQVPLHIYIHSSYSGYVSEDSKALVSCLVKEVPRWKGLICGNGLLLDMIEELVEGVAPTLEYFKWIGNTRQDPEVPSLIQRRAPKLNRLEISGLSLVPLNLPILSRLKALRFNPTHDMLHSHTHWERLFLSLPEIEIFEARQQYPSLFASGELPIPFDVKLPHLQELHLSGLPVGITSTILSSITLNSCQDCPLVTIHGDFFRNVSSGSLPATPRHSSLLSVIRDSTTELVFGGLNGWDTKHKGRKIFGFAGDWLRGSDGVEVDTLLTLFGRLDLLHITMLRIECISSLCNGTLISEVQNLHMLEDLYVTGFRFFALGEGLDDEHDAADLRTMSKICQALSAPRKINGGKTLAWPCPKLKVLHFDSWPDWEPVLHLVQARHGSGASLRCPAPTPLRKLTLSGNSLPLSHDMYQLFEEIRCILDVSNTELCIE
ncbi:hypothetical protein FRC02_010351 [Tulasnella sp. 418]|nr:hypothetical protein FRC02_010351 [Tulasnella sp. 418]